MSEDSYTAVVIPADEDEPVRRVVLNDDGDSSLRQLQEIVGGNIEAVPYHASSEVTTYVHEEGKYVFVEEDGTAKVNARATRLMAPGLFAGDWIAGPLVVCGFDAETGENRDCPEGFEDVIR
jgi:hypothetical protein